MKLWRFAALLLVVLTGCSKSGSSSSSSSGTVQAQSGFSNATITGSYGWDFSGRIGSGGIVTTTVLGTGTLVANGGVFNGGFSETTVSISNGAITVCSGSISGGYNIGPSGAGTSTINLIGSINQNGPGPCAFGPGAIETFNLVIANQGHTLVFSSTGPNSALSMSAGSQ